MKKELISSLHSNFDSCSHNEEGVEFWYARDLQRLLGYTQWRNFELVINKAKVTCENSGFQVSQHFVDTEKEISLGSGSTRSIRDIKLTRYACYIISQNGDSRKDEIAFAQSYFAIQTRKQELVEERIKNLERINARDELRKSEAELSENIFEHGVDRDGFGRIRSKGDKALFGGISTAEMKKRLGVAEHQPLADKLPTVTISAKNFATEITNFNVVDKDLQGEESITSEHTQNNSAVREILLERGITPENLPPEEDIKKIERKVKKDEKLLVNEARGFENE